MKTEISTEVSYQVQNQDQIQFKWFNWGALQTDKLSTENTIARLRAAYPDIVFRLLCITTTTEVVG